MEIILIYPLCYSIRMYFSQRNMRKFVRSFFKKTARMLRISYFMFGKLYVDENYGLVPKSLKGYVLMLKFSSSSSSSEISRNSQHLALKNDITYVRVPNTDHIKVISGNKMLVKVDKYNRILEKINKDSPMRNTNKTRVVTIPPMFRLRVIAMLIMFCVVAIARVTIVLALTATIGSYSNKIMDRDVDGKEDIVTLLIGFNILYYVNKIFKIIRSNHVLSHLVAMTLNAVASLVIIGLIGDYMNNIIHLTIPLLDYKGYLYYKIVTGSLIITIISLVARIVPDFINIEYIKSLYHLDIETPFTEAKNKTLPFLSRLLVSLIIELIVNKLLIIDINPIYTKTYSRGMVFILPVILPIIFKVKNLVVNKIRHEEYVIGQSIHNFENNNQQ